MSLSPHKQHKIYIAATMEYGLGSKDPEELAYYEMIKNEIAKNKTSGIQRTDYSHMSKQPKEMVLNTFKIK